MPISFMSAKASRGSPFQFLYSSPRLSCSVLQLMSAPTAKSCAESGRHSTERSDNSDVLMFCIMVFLCFLLCFCIIALCIVLAYEYASDKYTKIKAYRQISALFFSFHNKMMSWLSPALCSGRPLGIKSLSVCLVAN